MAVKKRKAGRPPLAADEKRAYRCVIKLTCAQLETLRQDAKELGLPVAILARARVTGERIAILAADVIAPAPAKPPQAAARRRGPDKS
jgi:hypothetical protein